MSASRSFLSGNRRLRFFEDSIQDGYRAIYVLLGQDVWRQHAEHGVVGAIDEKAVGHGVQYDLFARNIEIDADHQSYAAHFLDEAVAFGEFGQAHAEVAAGFDY